MAAEVIGLAADSTAEPAGPQRGLGNDRRQRRGSLMQSLGLAVRANELNCERAALAAGSFACTSAEVTTQFSRVTMTTGSSFNNDDVCSRFKW